jgi:hypothetical protein
MGGVAAGVSADVQVVVLQEVLWGDGRLQVARASGTLTQQPRRGQWCYLYVPTVYPTAMHEQQMQSLPARIRACAHLARALSHAVALQVKALDRCCTQVAEASRKLTLLFKWPFKSRPFIKSRPLIAAVPIESIFA